MLKLNDDMGGQLPLTLRFRTIASTWPGEMLAAS